MKMMAILVKVNLADKKNIQILIREAAAVAMVGKIIRESN
jgi:hypothetical protein